MDVVKLHITPGFVRAKTSLTWQEVLFGIDNELLAPGAAVVLAAEQLTDDSSPALIELASLSPGERTRELVASLASPEDEDEDTVRAKWLYLVLAWIFEHRAAYADPLQAVEEVYADFGYPEIVIPFVRYMPSEEADLGSREANEGRLFEHWKRYLDETAPRYA